MTDLSTFTDNQLQEEIERRKKQDVAIKTRPTPIDNPDWGPLVSLCNGYVHDLSKQGWADEDYDHYIYEAAITAIYGEEV